MADLVTQLKDKLTTATGGGQTSNTSSSGKESTAHIGLIGLGVMGQNLALNIAEHGYEISVYNRTYAKTEDTVRLAEKEKLSDKLKGYKDMKEFVMSIKKPRAVIMLVTAGKPVDENIKQLVDVMESDDIIIDGGNEWFENTERRAEEVKKYGIKYMGMGVSGGEVGARKGPSLMPGGPREAYERVEPILKKISAQVPDSGPCVTWIGPGGAGNYVKMIHNGIEYGDMQLIAESYDLLKNLAGLDNDELSATFNEWNQGDLQSYLIEITAEIFKKQDKDGNRLVDKVLDKTGNKGTGKWTVQTAVEHAVPAPTMAAALDARYISALKDERMKAAKILHGPAKDAGTSSSTATDKVDKKALIKDIAAALYAAKICSYAQGMNVIKTAGEKHNWNLNLSEIARIWKGGCIIRAKFLDRITRAYEKNGDLTNLVLDESFAAELNERQDSLRRVLVLAIQHGVPSPAFANSIAYFDSYRRERLPANLTQSQRDYFGAHTYERVDAPAGKWFHSEWAQPEPDADPTDDVEKHSKDSAASKDNPHKHG